MTYYNDQTRKERARKYIKIKNLITKEKSKGRNFYSHHLINEKDITDENMDADTLHEITKDHHWIDLYFMSRKYRTFYNVAMQTKAMTATDYLDEKLAYEEPTPEHSYDVIKLEGGGAEWRFTDEYEEYYKRMQADKKEKLTQYFNSGVITTVNAQIVFDRTYVSGIGLYVTVDANSLTEEVIVNWINKFLDDGELETIGEEVAVHNGILKKMYNYSDEE